MKNQKDRKIAELEIREMELDDLPQVFHLGERLFTSRLAPYLYRTWDEYEVARMFLSEGDFCLVAEKNRDIVGFILGETISKFRSAWKYGYIVWIGVSSKYRRNGIAGKLLKHFVNLMKENNVRIVLVDTEAENVPAIEFFTKKGFGKIKKHIYMSMNLKKYMKK